MTLHADMYGVRKQRATKQLVMPKTNVQHVSPPSCINIRTLK